MSIIYEIKIEVSQFFFLLIFTFRFKKKLNNLWKNIIIRLLIRKKKGIKKIQIFNSLV